MDRITTAAMRNASKRTFWHWAQGLAWGAGMVIWVALIVSPRLGLHLLWNVLIPIAPALFVVAPGAWRNLCPLGSMSLASHHFGLSQGKNVSPVWRSRLYLGALILLLVVVPLRKVVLDTNGPLLAAVLAGVGLLAIGLGVAFNWKSSWCSSLCPVYPVELLYGSRPLVSVTNAHCTSCSCCVTPCSESARGVTPRSAVKTPLGRYVGIVLTGCFPGFVWGWYHVPTYNGMEGFAHLPLAYGLPYLTGGLTLALYLAVRKAWPKQDVLIGSIFAASAIITYYWFRLPAIFGIGNPAQAMFVDISHWLPSYFETALRIFELVAFSWLMVGRVGKRRAWELPLPVISHSSGRAGVLHPVSSY